MKLVLILGLIVALAGVAVAEDGKISVRADQPGHQISRYLTGACIEDVNHEIYGGLYSQMIFGESFQEPPRKESADGISGMWRIVRRGSAEGDCTLETDHPFTGKQSQRIRFESGQGEHGVENQGLNRWGLFFAGGKPYEGVVWARAEKLTELWVALESADGEQILAEKPSKIKAGDWQRLEFNLTPHATNRKGRFVLKLKQPGTVDLGYAFLQPGAWGRFKGLPVRRDVTEAMQDLGLTVLRYGGSMINHPCYRWKKMIGPRERREPYQGTWYAYSTDGWGIIDFMNFCEAAGFLGIPAFNMDETPQDMADFIEYANGPSTSDWGRKRTADGHPKPYHLRYMELGNEERVDEKYFARFKPLAEAIWAKDPSMTLVVGDFAYSNLINDPMNFTGSAPGLTNLIGQQRVLQLAKERNREVWFDVHVGTDGPRPDESFDGMFSFQNALKKVADGARQKVVIFEFNSGNHTQRRALANAIAINAVERDGRIPIAASANCLQPDGQNDNGWDQGLIFLNPAQVWFQPPGYVTQMVSRNYLPQSVPAQVEGAGLDVSAKRSEDGKTLALQVVNVSDKPTRAEINLQGFTPAKPTAIITELTGPLDARNSADKPDQIRPAQRTWSHEMQKGDAGFTFAPYSFTVMKFE